MHQHEFPWPGLAASESSKHAAQTLAHPGAGRHLWWAVGLGAGRFSGGWNLRLLYRSGAG